MRDILFVSIIFASLPVCVARPFFGVLMWTWIAFMVPQRLCWGFAWDFPAALLIGSATLAGFVLSREPKKIPMNVGTFAVMTLWVWMSVSTVFAHNPADALPAWSQRSKVLLMVFVMMSLVNDRTRFQQVCLVMAGSLGLLGAKGGLFTIQTGGQLMVLGPLVSSIGGNNHFAVALNMTLPPLLFLARETSSFALRWGLRACFAMSVIAVVGTYSRGGLLGLAVVALALQVKGRRRLWLPILLLAGVLAGSAFVPEKWFTRMHTLETYEADNSAMGRIYAWRLAWRLALARPLLGWGPAAMEDTSLYLRYYADSPIKAGVHSSYFQILSEGGLLTFAMWLFMNGWTMLTLQRLGSRFRKDKQHAWIANYADMFQIGLCGYFVSATFLEMGYFDLLFHIIGLTIVLADMAQSIEAAKPEPQPVPVWQPQLKAAASGAYRFTMAQRGVR